MGKIIAAPIPILILPPVADMIAPAIVGPPEHPRSPASASKANMSVPPFFTPDEAMLNVPGQKIPTAKPASPQPSSVITGFCTNTITRYAKTQRKAC